jgi:hypothetical protein
VQSPRPCTIIHKRKNTTLHRPYTLVRKKSVFQYWYDTGTAALLWYDTGSILWYDTGTAAQ